METLKITDEYKIVRESFNGIDIVLRIWRESQGEECDVKFDDAFARVNGWQSLNDFIEEAGGMEKLKSLFGCVPEWITYRNDGTVYFRQPLRTELN